MGLVAFKRRAEAVRYDGETFDGLDLRSMKAFGSVWQNCVFRNCKMDLTDFRTSRFENCRFDRCSLRLVNFGTSFFTSTAFDACDMEQASFVGCHFTDASFSDCRMAYGDDMFQNATCRVKMEFISCNLHGSNLDFREVDLGSLSFVDCNCWGAKISLGCAIFNGHIDKRMFQQLLALVARVYPDESVLALAGDQAAVVDRLMSGANK